jgi:hypothetical protein
MHVAHGSPKLATLGAQPVAAGATPFSVGPQLAPSTTAMTSNAMTTAFIRARSFRCPDRRSNHGSDLAGRPARARLRTDVMQKLCVTCLGLVVLVSACRPPRAGQSSQVQDFDAPAPPGQEEKWTESEPEAEAKPEKPPEPPPPAAPTSPPPDSGLGFNFGMTKTKAVGVCSQRGTWSKHEGVYNCSKTPEGSFFEGKPVLIFCGDKLCAVGLATVVDAKDYPTWKARYDDMKQVLVGLHGPPTVETTNVDAKCQTDQFVQCMDDGTATVEATWNWKEGHRVSLTMGKKKSGEGPSAIRFTSMETSSP